MWWMEAGIALADTAPLEIAAGPQAARRSGVVDCRATLPEQRRRIRR